MEAKMYVEYATLKCLPHKGKDGQRETVGIYTGQFYAARG